MRYYDTKGKERKNIFTALLSIFEQKYMSDTPPVRRPDPVFVVIKDKVETIVPSTSQRVWTHTEVDEIDRSIAEVNVMLTNGHKYRFNFENNLTIVRDFNDKILYESNGVVEDPRKFIKEKEMELKHR